MSTEIATKRDAEVVVSMDTVQGFEALQRVANLFAASDIVPEQYQGKKGLPNAVIAVDMAMRMGANPLMVMQNLYVVYNRPSWSAQFLIATFNKCGRFSSIRYEYQGKEGTDSWGCRAVTTELATGEVLTGPLVSIDIAKKEGWYAKNGSKWQKLPELMLRYRAATFLIRTVAPEIAMGLQTREEIEDAVDLEVGSDGVYTPRKRKSFATVDIEAITAGDTEKHTAVDETVVVVPADLDYAKAYARLSLLYNTHGEAIDAELKKHGLVQSLLDIPKDTKDQTYITAIVETARAVKE